MNRTDEISENLAQVRARIAAACLSADRSPDSVTLVAVTKTWPAADVDRLAQLGVTDVGENRDQEAAPKFEEVTERSLRWHFIGQLQRNKVRSVCSYADVVQSVDRESLATALASARDPLRPLTVLIQVSLDRSQGRGGVIPAELLALASQIQSQPPLVLGGLMAVAPLEADPNEAFEELAALHRGLLHDFPNATMLSAGMSGDLEPAIAHGATHVRVGSAILGGRTALK